MKKVFAILSISIFLCALCAPVITATAQEPAKKEVAAVSKTDCCKNQQNCCKGEQNCCKDGLNCCKDGKCTCKDCQKCCTKEGAAKNCCATKKQ